MRDLEDLLCTEIVEVLGVEVVGVEGTDAESSLILNRGMCEG